VKLNVVEIEDPCTEDWDAMSGIGAVRYCHLCKFNVYDLSEMSDAEAVALVDGTEGRLCVTFYERADGTVVTKDCAPDRLLAARRAAKRSLAVAGTFTAACVAFIVGISALVLTHRRKEPHRWVLAVKEMVDPGPAMIPNPPEPPVRHHRRRGGMMRRPH